MTRERAATPPAPEPPLEELGLATMESVTAGCMGGSAGAAPTDPNQAATGQPAAAAKPGAGNMLSSVMGIVQSLSGLAGAGGQGGGGG
jgi:hypothetical protein